MSFLKTRSKQVENRKPTGLLGISELAGLLGLDKSTVSEACKRGMPRTSLEAALEWRAAQPTIQSVAKSASIAEARLAKLNAETERIEFKTAVEKAEYLRIDEVREAATSIGSVLVAELNALANDLPGHLAGLSEIQIRDRLLVRLDLLVTKARTKLDALSAVKRTDLEEDAADH
jgi:hypothetical protein